MIYHGREEKQAGAELCQAQFQLIVSLITRLYTSKHLYDEDQRVDRDCKSSKDQFFCHPYLLNSTYLPAISGNLEQLLFFMFDYFIFFGGGLKMPK